MNRQALVLMGMAAVVFMMAGVILNRRLRRDAVLATRVHAVQRTVGIEAVLAPSDVSQPHWLRLAARIGEVITRGGLLSANTLDDLELRLNSAGFRGRNMLAPFIGTKLLSLVGLPLLAWPIVERLGWPFPVRLLVMAAAGLVGLLLPDYIVRVLYRRHLSAVERGLPDALDMLVICTEAGLGLELAIDRVGRELGAAHPDVAEELLNTAREMRVNADRRSTLMNMAARAGILAAVTAAARGDAGSERCNTARRSARRSARFQARCGRRR